METTTNLSEQAVMCLMIALQKALIEEMDYPSLLREMNFAPSEEGLYVTNPPEPISTERLEELAGQLQTEEMEVV